MAMSFLCSLGPVWYHPAILSLAVKEKNSGFELLHKDIYNTLKKGKNFSSYVLPFQKFQASNLDMLMKS